MQDRRLGPERIDRFILARLEKEACAVARSRPATLIRRVTLDLTGLPPSPAEVDAFLRDSRPAAYEELVDRLLASPHYGEQWRGGGWTSPAMPIPTVTRSIWRARSGRIATG